MVASWPATQQRVLLRSATLTTSCALEGDNLRSRDQEREDRSGATMVK